MAVESVIGTKIIDLLNDTNFVFELAPQSDGQERFVDLTILDNGVPYVLPNDANVILEGQNAGGYNIFNTCIILDRNTVRIPLTDGILAVGGVGKYSIAIYSENTYILSFPFNIVVIDVTYDIVALESSESYEALNRAVAKALSANKWIVGTGVPTSITAEVNDYYLDALTGGIYQYLYNQSQELIWQPVMNGNTQVTIMEKVYIRYADKADGTGFSTSPIGKAYVGFYCSISTEDAPDVSVPSNYKWSSITTKVKSTSTQYGLSDDNVIPPSTWSTTMPVAQSGKYIWTKIIITFDNNSTTQFMTATEHGVNAGFANPGASASINLSSGKPTIVITESGDFTQKHFDFAFSVRPGRWRSGTVITGNGAQTVVDFKDTDTVVGDVYLNTSTGIMYECTAVTSSNSTWNKTYTLTTVTTINDLDDTLRFFGLLHPGERTLAISGTGTMFNAADAEGDVYDYYIQYYFSNTEIKLKGTPKAIIGNNSISTTVKFTDSIINSMQVTPVGTENPHTKGWYEKSGNNYIVTSDTTVVSGKKYYENIIVTLEVIKKPRDGFSQIGAPMYPFATATDAQLQAMLNSYYNGEYTAAQITELKNTYLPIGAKRTIHLSAMDAIGVEDSHTAGDYEFVILDHEHDDLETPINGKTKALLTLNQEKILFNDSTAITYTSQYPSIAEGGGVMTKPNTNKCSWVGSQRRTWCNEVYYKALPSSVTGMIKSVIKRTSKGNQSSDIVLSTDKIFIPSISEIAIDTFREGFPDEGVRYVYFRENDNQNVSKSPTYNGGKSAYWWTRSPFISTDPSITTNLDTQFRCINNNGNMTRATSSAAMGISPAFCI